MSRHHDGTSFGKTVVRAQTHLANVLDALGQEDMIERRSEYELYACFEEAYTAYLYEYVDCFEGTLFNKIHDARTYWSDVLDLDRRLAVLPMGDTQKWMFDIELGETFDLIEFWVEQDMQPWRSWCRK